MLVMTSIVILFVVFLVTVMHVWHYAAIEKYEFNDLHNKVSMH